MKKKNNLGVMIDMSRNSVMTVSALKSFMKLLKRFGYNTVMLYIEDTYEVEGEPYFGYMRGRYTVSEMQDIDAFAHGLGMTLIPGIQTLAHLNGFVKWNQIPWDIEDILLVDDDRCYEFIENLFKSIKSAFPHSKIVHIGMDEAWKLGRGTHINKYGYEDASELMRRHSARVVELAKKYEFHPIMWGDMFIRSWNDGVFWVPKTEVPAEIVASVPADVELGCWNYNSLNEDFYDAMFYNMKQLSDDIWFAGGCWGWSGIAPHNSYSLKTMGAALASCRRYGIKNILACLWGDDGGECSHYTQLPALFHIAEMAKGNYEIDKIKAKFERIVGLPYDDFMKLDLPNEICDNVKTSNPSKYMLYSDFFAGFLDYTVSEGVGEKYSAYAQELSAVAARSRKWAYIFKTEAKLCELLSVKYELGVKTRRAYRSGDREELRRLADEEYKLLSVKYREFHKLYYKQWHTENEGAGFDIQDHRLGGMMARIDTCRRSIYAYLDGTLPHIKELEYDILPYGGSQPGEPIRVSQFNTYSSVNIISH